MRRRRRTHPAARKLSRRVMITPPPEADTPVEEEVAKEKVKDEKKSVKATPPEPVGQESDSETEYDNAEIDVGRDEGAATQAISDSSRLSARWATHTPHTAPTPSALVTVTHKSVLL